MRREVIGPCTLVLGDCLEYLPTLAAGSVDAIVTDPPYSSGGQFRGDRSQSATLKYVQTDSVETCRIAFTGDNRDQRSFLLWCSLWMGAALQAAKPGAIIACFTDWRQLPTMTDAIQCGGWVWRNVATWWKPGVRMQRGRFSSSAEYVVYGSHGVPTEGEESPQNVTAVQPVAGEDKEHIAEKPVEVVEWILGVTPAGSLVVDPFTGAGTTAEACIRTGRRFIGCELDPRSFDIACRRVEKALDDQALFAPREREVQGELLGANP